MGGTKDTITGRAKEAAGALTDDSKLRREGRMDQAAGDVKDAGQSLADKVSDGAKAASDQLDETIDRVRKSEHRD